MYLVYLVISTLLLLCEFVRLTIVGFSLPLLNEFMLMIINIITSVSYLYIYRKRQLFCFESLFLVFAFLISFYSVIVLNISIEEAGLIGSLFKGFGDGVRIKALYVSVIAIQFFVIGCYRSDSRSKQIEKNNGWEGVEINHKRVYFAALSSILTFFTIVYFLYLLLIGYVNMWFHYSNDVYNYDNNGIINLTILCLSSTVLQFSKYSNHNVTNFNYFLTSVDKVYLFVISIISILLLVSGNRNEALYIILPVVVCYSIFIKPITNKQFLIMAGGAFFLMSFIGQTRDLGVTSGLSEELTFNLFNLTQDFGFANIDTMYLIDYVDKKGIMGLTNGIITLFSSIPFLGGIMVYLFELNEFTRSATAVTEGMDVSYTGLGTSLVGDTYYTGTIIFTILYFYFLGRLMSYLHNRFFARKQYNVYLLILYAFMFSNAIYCLRSEWYTSFRYIGFSMVLVFVLRLLLPNKNYR